MKALGGDDAHCLEQALFLARLGFAVHWLRRPEGGRPDGRGKAPIDKNWQHRPWLSPQQLRVAYRPGLNLGIHTGLVLDCASPVVVVDADDPGAISWCYRVLPWTPLAAKTRHGVHFFYRRGTELHAPTRGKVGGMALDVRGDGGNVVVSPSRHPEGGRYEWLRSPVFVRWSELPVYAPSWFPAPTAPVPVVPHQTIDRTADEAYKRACAYARSTPPAVAGQGGSLATFKLAVALVRGFALHEEHALGVLAAEFNPRCQPPWNEAELRHKVAYAKAAGRIPVGSLLGHRQAVGDRR